MHIENLYKVPEMLYFRRLYALEKIHGTSAHVAWRDAQLHLFAGGVSQEMFEKLFDRAKLSAAFGEIGQPNVTVFGEAYGGKCQKMKDTYGPDLRFVAFEVKIGDSWLAVPQAEALTVQLGIEFVHYREIDGTVEAVEREVLEGSVQAGRNGMGAGHMREGIVLRPLLELRKNNDERLIAKHKRLEFQERQHVPKPGQTPEVFAQAQQVAVEWVTPMRLTHVLDKFPEPHTIAMTGDVIRAMLDDVMREGAGEIVDSKDVRKAIGNATAHVYHARLAEALV